MENFDSLRAAWLGEPVHSGEKVRAWPEKGIAIEGDFSGIQRFVLRPVPGASGAARRLRARSFRVLALTRLVATAVEERFRGVQARLFYSAGGRFLVVSNFCSDWRERIAVLQGELDVDLLNSYLGELVFHLAGAEFTGGNIPVAELRESMIKRKQTPLAGALRSNNGWAGESRFVFRATEHEKCDGCASTALLAEGNDSLCRTCVDDRELGKGLLTAGRVALTRSKSGGIVLLGNHWTLSDNGEISVPLVSHAPTERGQLATFEDLSNRAAGRGYLAFLRIDADRIGEKFRDLAGQPERIRALSKLLDGAFSSCVSHLIASQFPNLYPVYGGGDDLFVIGPWNDILDFASAWREEFRAISGDQLSFSAGVALAKPRQHILTKSEEAERALNEHAKASRDSIHALGCTIPWSEFPAVLEGARRMASLLAEGQIRSALLHNLIELHSRWRRGDARWHSLLFYQTERNLSGAGRDFVKHAFLSPGKLWRYANFAAQYNMLGATSAERN
jgi:CRISPR-associated protein Csm1